MLTIEYFLYFLLTISGIVIIHLIDKARTLKARVSKLEKRIYKNMTDFEKLEFAAELINDVDISKLRSDQKDLWNGFIEGNIITVD
jgi:hypothetical protein